eukprot:CAMPEP_0117450644 /NCGR_PEP_ID=MMETSP0759-20121206/8580_1 /TAXON_ID=63605 /ORGANISM="Percolomonas cosmopolitus, Strain WS" /LENGTH=347 /DNA_ID=CAMNT_0005243183 /DNA_START=245 /DNA_END=1288 /DNA_ORIENTATION=-
MTYQVQAIHPTSPAEVLCDTRPSNTLIAHSCRNEIRTQAANLVTHNLSSAHHNSTSLPNQIHPYIDHIVSLDTFPITHLEANPLFYQKYLDRSMGQSVCLRVWSLLTQMERNVWISPELKTSHPSKANTFSEDNHGCTTGAELCPPSPSTKPSQQHVCHSHHLRKPANTQSQQIAGDSHPDTHELNTHLDNSEQLHLQQDCPSKSWIGLNCRIVNVHEAKNWIWRILSIRKGSEADRLKLQEHDYILGANGLLFEEKGKWPLRVDRLLVYRWHRDILEEVLLQPNQELGCEIVMDASHSAILFDKWVRLMEHEIDAQSRLMEQHQWGRVEDTRPAVTNASVLEANPT